MSAVKANPHDVRIEDVGCWLLPIELRMPLKFGNQVLTHASCARVCVRVQDGEGRMAEGWGETPLSVAWVWPSDLDYEWRMEALSAFAVRLAQDLKTCDISGHPMEIGYAYQQDRLGALHAEHDAALEGKEGMPYLAALVALSAFDIALHDAYGALHGVPVYETYAPPYMNRDLAAYLTPADDAEVSFAGKFPADFLVEPARTLPVWHLVGGLDPLEPGDLTGQEPDDGYPVLLRDWIRRDGLNCLKVKLRGTDAPWDYDRLVRVGEIGAEENAQWLTADFNCTVRDPAYVNDIVDRLRLEHPEMFERILYIEQPFPYDLEANQIDVHSVAKRRPLFLDESAHDWKFVKLGRRLGWTGVAHKTCKTQTGALLSLAWAKAHGMDLMVQDLTNPMLSQIPHVLLAAHAGTIMGVETNSMQFYPEASLPEQAVHPGLYRRRNGMLDLSTVRGPGFGYRLAEIVRELPEPAVGMDVEW